MFKPHTYRVIAVLAVAATICSAARAGGADPASRLAGPWYTPQYLNTAYQLSEVQLPPRGKTCVDSYNPKLGSNWSIYKCAYGDTVIDKVIATKFAKSGSPAVGVIKRWKWTADDQNQVANMIAGQHIDPAKAAEQWVKANTAKVNVWLGK